MTQTEPKTTHGEQVFLTESQRMDLWNEAYPVIKSKCYSAIALKEDVKRFTDDQWEYFFSDVFAEFMTFKFYTSDPVVQSKQFVVHCVGKSINNIASGRGAAADIICNILGKGRFVDADTKKRKRGDCGFTVEYIADLFKPSNDGWQGNSGSCYENLGSCDWMASDKPSPEHVVDMYHQLSAIKALAYEIHTDHKEVLDKFFNGDIEEITNVDIGMGKKAGSCFIPRIVTSLRGKRAMAKASAGAV